MNDTLTYKSIKEQMDENPDLIIPCTFDGAFKALCLTPSFRPLLCLIISKATELDYDYVLENLVIVDPELLRQSLFQKGKNTDLLCTIEGNVVNLECNRNREPGLLNKNNTYHHTLAGNPYLVGDNYKDKVFSTYQINFNATDDFDKDDRIIIPFTLRDPLNVYEDEKTFKRIQVCLPKAKKKYYNSIELEREEKLFAMMHTISRQEIRAIAKGDRKLMETAKTVENLSRNKDIIRLYDRQQAEERAKLIDLRAATDKATEEGTKKGIEQGKKEIALKLRESGMPIKEISKIVDLSEEEINLL